MFNYPVLYRILSLAGVKTSFGLMGLILQNSKSSLVVSESLFNSNDYRVIKCKSSPLV